MTDTISLMKDVGFVIHDKKSVVIPTKKINFLGNCIDSEQMIVTLPESKVINLTSECKNLVHRTFASIRYVAKIYRSDGVKFFLQYSMVHCIIGPWKLKNPDF